MTELEQKLLDELEAYEAEKQELQKLQEKAFKKELSEITSLYNEQMNTALEVIEKQAATLKKYEKISTNWQISINEDQLTSLQNQLTLSQDQLTSLQNQLNQLNKS